LFSKALIPVTAHCEDEPTIRKNSEIYRLKYGDDVPVSMHPLIRSREACYLSSSHAVNLAKEYNTRLHILHLSTADELKLFSNELPLNRKRITGEVCVHHLWFEESSYDELGNMIKWNPAIKTRFDRDALINGVNNNIIDIVATDHAPHTLAITRLYCLILRKGDLSGKVIKLTYASSILKVHGLLPGKTYSISADGLRLKTRHSAPKLFILLLTEQLCLITE
jgi:hypothetical protein